MLGEAGLAGVGVGVAGVGRCQELDRLTTPSAGFVSTDAQGLSELCGGEASVPSEDDLRISEPDFA